MISAYIDESGTHGSSHVLCVSGVYCDEKTRKLLDGKWKKELKRAGIKYYHTVEQCHLTDQFEGRSHPETNEIHKNFVNLARNFTLGSVTVCIIYDIYRPGPCPFSHYTVCAYECISQLLKVRERLGHSSMAAAIEKRSEQGELDRLLETMHQLIDGWDVLRWQFVSKRDMPGVQAADIMAYEMFKRVTDLRAEMLDPTREKRRRKSLESIINNEDQWHHVLVFHEREFRATLRKIKWTMA
jgi:hypothetical protein